MLGRALDNAALHCIESRLRGQKPTFSRLADRFPSGDHRLLCFHPSASTPPERLAP